MMNSARASSANGRPKSAAPPTRAFSRSGTTVGAVPTSLSNIPTGRIEMLLWLESRCGRQVETIEGLREGVYYAMVLADLVHQSGDPAVSSKSDSAFDIVDHKLDMRINLGTTPQQDSIQVTEACERNLQAVQTIIRSCIPKRLGLEIDVPKMAKGAMQDHMHFLRWLVQLPKKIPPAAAAPSAFSRTSTASGKDNKESDRGTSIATKKQSGLVNAHLGPTTLRKANSAARPSADPSLIEALLAIQKEIVALEEEAIQKGGSGSSADNKKNSSTTPALAFADVQAREDHRDALSDTLTKIAELVRLSGDKASMGRQPACPLQLELQKVFE